MKLTSFVLFHILFIYTSSLTINKLSDIAGSGQAIQFGSKGSGEPYKTWGASKAKESYNTSISEYSPIDIKWFNTNKGIRYPAFPRYFLNGTYYNLVNHYMFSWFYVNPADPSLGVDLKIVLAPDDFSTAITNFRGTKLKFSLKEIRLKMYSEHSFEGMKMDLEFQLIHIITPESNQTLNLMVTDPDMPRPSQTMAVSVMFSASMDKESDFIEQIFYVDPYYDYDYDNYVYIERADFTRVLSLDFNQFTDKHEPYYYYKGTGTTPLDFDEEMDWFIMKKVNYMSQSQFDYIQKVVKRVYPNGNSLVPSIDSDEYASNNKGKHKFVEYHSNEETSYLFKHYSGD